MKTIEEASKDYAKKNVDQCVNITIDSLKEYAYQDFKAGVGFAQQWINVEDELPPIGKVILLKFDDDYTQISTGIYNGTELIDDFGFDEERCTHWRPIEYK